MRYEQYAALAMDYKSMICYICDIQTHEILYLNRAARNFFEIASEEDYQNTKCYTLFQEQDTPCIFCQKNGPQRGKPVYREQYYKKRNQYLEMEEHLIEIEGRMCRMGFSQDIATHKEKIENLQMRLTAEETLIRCMQILMQEADTELAINHILEIIGKFYQSTRVYIFENNYKKALFHNTYEWCEEGNVKYIEKLQNISLESIQPWLDKFREDGEIIIDSMENIKREYTTLPFPKEYNLENVFLVPLIRDTCVVGFIGVDNVKANKEHISLLRSMAYFMLNDLDKRRRFQQLEYTSYTDMLTGLRNRNKYLKKLQEYDETPPKTMGVVFIDVNGMKTINDTHGHSYGDFIIKRIAQILQDCMGETIFRIGGDEFVSLCENMPQKEFDEKVSELRKRVAADEKVCISIGSKWKSGSINVKEEVFSADELMYQEKQEYYKKLAKKGRSKAHDMI